MIYMYACISYIPGMSALPDIYARLPEGTHLHTKVAMCGSLCLATLCHKDGKVTKV